MLYLILLLVVASLGLLIAALTTANTLWAWISVLISVVAAGLLVFDWIKNRRRRSREAPAARRRPEPVIEEHEQPFVAPLPAPPVAETPQERTVTSQEQAVPSQDRDVPSQEWSGPPQGQAGDPFPDAFEESFRDFDAQLGSAQRGSAQPRLGEPPFGNQFGSQPIEPPEPVTAIQEPITAIQQPVVDMDSEPGEENTDATDVLTVSELSDEVVVIDERPRYHLLACAWVNGRPTMPLPVSEARELGFTPCALCAPDSTLAARQRARS
jgi:hypothetical protein